MAVSYSMAVHVQLYSQPLRPLSQWSSSVLNFSTSFVVTLAALLPINTLIIIISCLPIRCCYNRGLPLIAFVVPMERILIPRRWGHRLLSSWRPSSIREVTLPGTFVTALNGKLSGITVKVEVHGHSSLPANRTVLVFPSFSHSSHVSSNADDPSPGWWQEIVGSAKAVDTRHWRVVCLSVVGSPFSTTQPASTNPDTGKPYRATFPQISPTDVARVHRAVLEHIGISEPVHAAVGASFGGMQVLQYASLFPDLVQRIIAISCTGRTTPFTMLVRRMQRRAILSDPGYLNGDYADHDTGPWEGLKQAREFGTLFYR